MKIEDAENCKRGRKGSQGLFEEFDDALFRFVEQTPRPGEMN
jgi:hypothetical protein